MIKRLRQWEAELGTTHLARFYAVGLLLFGIALYAGSVCEDYSDYVVAGIRTGIVPE